MTKATLTALGAALIALGNELQGEEPTATEAAPTTRRGRGPAKTEPPAEPVAGEKTTDELKEIARPVIEGGKGDKVKAFLAEHKATKISDLPAPAHTAFVTLMKKLTLEVEAEQM